MKLRPESYFSLFMLLLGLFIIFTSFTFAKLEASLLPLILGIALVVLSAAQLGKEIVAKVKVRGDEGKSGEPVYKARDTQLRRFGSTLAWLVGFTVVIHLLGFLVSIPLFTFSYIKWRGRGWLSAISVAIIMTVILYGTFEIGFKIRLYGGLIARLW